MRRYPNIPKRLVDKVALEGSEQASKYGFRRRVVIILDKLRFTQDLFGNSAREEGSMYNRLVSIEHPSWKEVN